MCRIISLLHNDKNFGLPPPSYMRLGAPSLQLKLSKVVRGQADGFVNLVGVNTIADRSRPLSSSLATYHTGNNIGPLAGRGTLIVY